MEQEDPFDLVAALQSQVEANAERLRRTRRMVDVISEHLQTAPAAAKKPREKPRR